ncbi:MAG: asparagine synthase (glutamine-hydrolyzing) [Clostridiaceae bacterium]
MCGFVGFLSDDTVNNKDKEMLTLMNSSISHRGPDDKGTYCDDKIFIAFRRLSIIALDTGKQPFSYDDGRYNLIFNGEIYNYIELRNMLMEEGIEFKTDAEAEVMLALYKHKGKDFVKLLRGMFAFVIWDRESQILLGARDPFGIKPFYYTENKRGLYFTSELKSFIYNEDTRTNKVDIDSLQNYLTFQFVPEPKTILENINILEPGCIIEKSLNKKSTITRYWNVEFAPSSESQEIKLGKIREVMKDSVAMHMRSDVPVGCFLSGGIDSTIIAALARDINPDIKSFTAGFDVNGYSEIDLAKETAHKLDIENISVKVTPEEFVKELPKIIWHLDGPVADASVVPIYFISREARKHVKVMLSGEGSDELFGGYTIYREPLDLSVFNHVPTALKSGLIQLSKIIPEGVKGKSFLERGCTPIEDRYVGNAKIFRDNEKSEFLKQYNKNSSYNQVTRPYYNEANKYDNVTKMQYIDINTWLRGDILLKSDRMSMANSLELRVPFLDKEVFKVASSLNLDDKLGNKTTKYLLREAFRNYIPDDVTTRRKLGYPVPIRIWLKDELYDWAHDLIINSGADEYINKENVLKLLEEHRKGPFDLSRKLWTLLTFLEWHKLFIEDVENYNEIIV